MPAYNEAENIEAALQDVCRDVLSVVADAELIVVDDGSSDSTGTLVRKFCETESRVRLLTQQNAGHGPALRTGIDAATGDVLLLLDSDRQICLEGFDGHWQILDGALLGVRKPRNDPASRLVITQLMRGLIRLLFGAAPKDAGVPYKLIHRDLWEKIRPLIAPGSWIPSVLLAVTIQKQYPDQYHEIVVRHLARTGGTSTLRLGRLATFCIHAARELFQLRRQMTNRAQAIAPVQRLPPRED